MMRFRFRSDDGSRPMIFPGMDQWFQRAGALNRIAELTRDRIRFADVLPNG